MHAIRIPLWEMEMMAVKHLLEWIANHLTVRKREGGGCAKLYWKKIQKINNLKLHFLTRNFSISWKIFVSCGKTFFGSEKNIGSGVKRQVSYKIEFIYCPLQDYRWYSKYNNESSWMQRTSMIKYFIQWRCWILTIILIFKILWKRP